MAGGDDGEVLVAGGLLEGMSALTPGITVEEATERLREALSPAALWVRGGASGQRLAELADRGLLGERAPRWTEPTIAIDAELAAVLRAAWEAATPERQWNYQPFLRLTVSGTDDADRLTGIARVEPFVIVPCVAKQARYFAWRWPLRIGIAAGPSATAWRDQLHATQYARELFAARIVDDADLQPVEIMLIDAHGVAMRPDRTHDQKYQSTCVVMVGADATAAELLERAATEFDPAIAVGVPADGIAGFERMLDELAHDHPVDVAFAIAFPAARVAAEPGLVNLTAVARWAYEVAPRLPDFGMGPGLRQTVEEATFDHEYGGARGVVAHSRRLEEHFGADATLVFRLAMAGAQPGTSGSEPPAPRPQPVRRLIGEVREGGSKRRTVLRPETDHQLEVRIAVPKRGEIAADAEFPETGLPETDVVATLTVQVSSAALGLSADADISIPVANRAEASTSAVFAFRTGLDGSVAEIEILVLHKGRPLQEATLVAPVRLQAVPSDKVRLFAHSLTADPDPVADPTPADVTLVARGAQLTNIANGQAIDLDVVKQMLDDVEQTASKVLANDDAPGSLSDPLAVELLIKLARWGTELRDFLSDLDIDDADTVALLVGTNTPVLPLELVYAGPTPTKNAKLCRHATDPGSAPDGPCQRASTKVVCPYAFWGMGRTVARTFRVEHGTAARSPLVPLSLTPVLYAAAARADAESPDDARPSDLLQRELSDLVGAAALTRVTSWRAWRSAVKSGHPQLLVVLGHTETTGGEMTIEIGEKSRLARPDVNTAVLRGEVDPKPLVVLLACASAAAGDTFGGLPAAFTGRGAAAVVATLSKLKGPQGASAAAAVVRALRDSTTDDGVTLGRALTAARRQLVADGVLVGLLLVAHGEIDLLVTT